MTDYSARPLDFLNERKGRKILVTLKSGEQFSGNLLAFDLYINLTIDEANQIDDKNDKILNLGSMFIRGDTISWIV